MRELEEHIEELELSLNQLLNSDVNETRSSQLKLNNCKIKLPEIPFSQFRGMQYEEWDMFEIKFNNIVINNEQLLKVHKLHNIHITLKNETKLLENLKDAFLPLFRALDYRFENKWIKVNIHLKDILEFKRIIDPSKELIWLIDTINKNIRALSNLGFVRNNLSSILFITIQYF